MLVRDELGHDPGANGRAHRELLGTRIGALRRHSWWRQNERRTLARRSQRRYDYLIVGAGFAGSVLAERLASQHGARVLLIDRRPHVGGNAYDEPNEAGILYHKYGPHIFHTNSEQVSIISRSSPKWRPYEHRVRAYVRGQLVPIPINRTTLNELFGLDLKTDEEAADYLASRAEPVDDIKTSEDVVINAVGRELYELFFRGYTRKQWGLDPSELDKQVTSRIPTRTNTDDRYFSDTFQAMPLARLHHDVREDARQSADREAASESIFATSRIERSRSPITSSTPGRSTNISTSASASCRTDQLEVRSSDAWSRSSTSRSRSVNYPCAGRAVHAHQRVQASDRARNRR